MSGCNNNDNNNDDDTDNNNDDDNSNNNNNNNNTFLCFAFSMSIAVSDFFVIKGNIQNVIYFAT